MIDPAPRSTAAPRIGVQPIAIAAVALALVLIGIGSIAMWRTYTGDSPETDRVVATRQLQARTAQASEQLVEKTKGLEATQQELIDQLQVVQDQLQTVPPPDRGATGRHQEAVRAGRRPDRVDRRLAAVLCQRAGDRAGGSAHAETVRRDQERAQARQIERLSRAGRTAMIWQKAAAMPLRDCLPWAGSSSPSNATVVVAFFSAFVNWFTFVRPIRQAAVYRMA